MSNNLDVRLASNRSIIAPSKEAVISAKSAAGHYQTDGAFPGEKFS